MKTNILSKLLVISFTVFIIILSIAFIIKDESRYLYNVFAIYILILIFFYYERKRDLNISNYSKILVSLTLILHLLFGQYYDLYKTSSVFDKALHLFGAFGISLFLYELLISLIYPVSISDSILLIFILIVSIGVTIGTLFEIMEFILDKIFDTNNQKGLKDTNLDLIFNVLGATIAAYRMSKRYSKT